MRKLVVTGASSEIGLAVCRALYREGDRLIAHYRSNGEGVARWAADAGGFVEAVRADFADQKDLTEFCGRIAETEVLINAAGVTKTGLLPEMTDADVRVMLEVNAVALVSLCRAVLPGMVARRSGCIVNISSSAARRGNPGQSVYAASKGFVEAFTRSLASEYGRRGIRINCVSPGPIEAGSMKDLLAYAGDEVKGSVALGRLGKPAEVGAAVAFLCGDGASYISGACLSVDGGQLRGV